MATLAGTPSTEGGTLCGVPDSQAHCGRCGPRADACTPGLVVGPGVDQGRSLGAWILLLYLSQRVGFLGGWVSSKGDQVGEMNTEACPRPCSASTGLSCWNQSCLPCTPSSLGYSPGTPSPTLYSLSSQPQQPLPHCTHNSTERCRDLQGTQHPLTPATLSLLYGYLMLHTGTSCTCAPPTPGSLNASRAQGRP